MEISLTIQDIKTLRRLRIALRSGVVLTNDTSTFLEDIQRKIDSASARPSRKINTHKEARKNSYRASLKKVA
jgi:hypothetical protein